MKTVFLNIHATGISGSIDYFRDFLLRNNYNIISVYNPLDNYFNKETVIYYNESVIKKYKRKNLSILNLFVDFFISLKYIRRYDFSTFIGANNFDTFVGIFAKNILRKRIDKIIYFASDFSEKRFNKLILDKIYYLVEKVVLKNSDLVISNTKRSEVARINLGLNINNSIIIPNGVLFKNEIFVDKAIDKSRFVYIGSVNKEHGLMDMLYKISNVIKEVFIIGSGNDMDRIENFLKEKNIKYTFFGNKEHSFTMDFLQKFSGFGLAPYNDKESWTYYCSPLKVNEYIASGVPVIMSDIPEIAEFISNNNLGIVYNDLNNEDIESYIEGFDVSGYNKRAEWFYNLYNQNNLYSKIII